MNFETRVMSAAEYLLVNDGTVEESSPKARPASRSVFQIYISLFFSLLFFLCILSLGILLLGFPSSANDLIEWLGLDGASRSMDLRVVAIVLIVFSLVAPLFCTLFCVWRSTPNRASRARDAMFSDALLEEICSGSASLRQIYDVYGAENKEHGTLLFINAGLGAPRQVMAGFARHAAQQNLRALVVDLPGHGSLCNVTFSLARCERVLLAVVGQEMGWVNAAGVDIRGDRGGGEVNHPDDYLGSAGSLTSNPMEALAVVKSSQVVLCAYSCATYPAAYFAHLHPSLTAGFVLLGTVPRLTSSTFLYARLLRLPWMSTLRGLAMVGRVQAHPRASALIKSELGACEWSFGVLPDLLREVKGAPFPLILSLRRLPRPILMLGPSQWISKASRILPVPHARFVVSRGLRDDVLPTLVDEKQANIATALARFAVEAITSTAYLLAHAASEKEAARLGNRGRGSMGGYSWGERGRGSSGGGRLGRRVGGSYSAMVSTRSSQQSRRSTFTRSDSGGLAGGSTPHSGATGLTPSTGHSPSSSPSLPAPALLNRRQSHLRTSDVNRGVSFSVPNPVEPEGLLPSPQPPAAAHHDDANGQTQGLQGAYTERSPQ